MVKDILTLGVMSTHQKIYKKNYLLLIACDKINRLLSVNRIVIRILFVPNTHFG